MGENVPKGSKFEKQLTKNYNFDKKVRGEYLIQTSWVELFISEIIAFHFVPNDKKKQELLSSIIVGEIRFADKIMIFSNLIRKYYPKIKEKYPILIDDLSTIRNYRNRLAHYTPYTKKEYISKFHKNKIRLVSYKHGKEMSKEITKKEFKKELSKCMTVTEILSDISDDLYDRMNGTLSLEKNTLYDSK